MQYNTLALQAFVGRKGLGFGCSKIYKYKFLVRSIH